MREIEIGTTLPFQRYTASTAGFYILKFGVQSVQENSNLEMLVQNLLKLVKWLRLLDSIPGSEVIETPPSFRMLNPELIILM